MSDFESWLGGVLRAILPGLIDAAEPRPPCPYCEEPILDGEPTRTLGHFDGSVRAWHRECFTRTLFGPVGHLLRQCTHHGGTAPCDPEGMTRREAARAAFDVWEATRSGRFQRGGDA